MGKAREKQAKTRENTRKQAKNRRFFGAFLVLIFLGEKLVGANFYAFCNYENSTHKIICAYTWLVFLLLWGVGGGSEKGFEDLFGSSGVL